MNRSFIFVPAKEKMLQKVDTFTADRIILDLEDSIEQADKENALDRVLEYLRKTECIDKIIVRLNKNRYMSEAKQLSRFPIHGFMLPKFETIDDYSDCIDIWSNYYIYALVETPLGMIHLDEIASCEWVFGIAFGAEDYTCRVNMDNSIRALYYQKSSIVTYCKSYEKIAIDTPSFKLNDEDAFMAEVDDAVSLGFDGKMLIHPKHIDYINMRFNTSDTSFLQSIVNQYELSGEAVLVIDGKVYEKMHIDRFKKILRENGGNEK